MVLSRFCAGESAPAQRPPQKSTLRDTTTAKSRCKLVPGLNIWTRCVYGIPPTIKAHCISHLLGFSVDFFTAPYCFGPVGFLSYQPEQRSPSLSRAVDSTLLPYLRWLLRLPNYSADLNMGFQNPVCRINYFTPTPSIKRRYTPGFPLSGRVRFRRLARARCAAPNESASVDARPL